nr:hypothetical protein [Rhizobium rhizogenes]
MFDNAFEWHVAIVECLEACVMHPLKQLGKFRIFRKIDAHDHRVAEKPDELVERGIMAQIHSCAEGNVLPGADAFKRYRDGRLERHERRTTISLCRLPQGSGQPMSEPTPDLGSREARHCRARAIERERDFHGEIAQLDLPETQLFCMQACGVLGIAEVSLLP